MNRRKFIIASGSAILSGSAFRSSQEPVLGLELQVSTKEQDVEPNELDSILVKFDTLELTPQNLDENETLTVISKVEIDGITKKSKTDINPVNGRNTDLSQQISPIYVDGVNVNRSFISGKVTVSVNHNDISDEYIQRFNISGSGTQLISAFENNNIDPWRGNTGAWTTTTNNAIEGKKSLKGNGTGDTAETIFSEPGDGLEYYPSKGDIISAYHRENNSTNDRIRAGIGWAIEQLSGTTLNGYGIDPQGDNNEVILNKYDSSGGFYDLERVLSISFSDTDFLNWIEIEVEWHNGNGSEAEDTFVINVYEIDDSGSAPFQRIKKLGSGKYQDSDFSGNKGVSIRNHTTSQSERTCIDRFAKIGEI
jgi:FlaG/FlaF family flagellin (archaellin)